MKYTRKKRSIRDIIKKTVLPKTFNLADIVYNKPKRDDLAVGLVYFNANKSKRILMNYLYTVEKLKIAGIPNFTMEMYTEHSEIKDAFHVKTDFILFQKERLCRLLEKRIPRKYTKIVFIDGDIVFDNVNWYNDLSDELETHNVIQPFERVFRLNLTYTKIIDETLTYVLKKKFGDIRVIPNTNLRFSPGGAWGFQRAWFNRVGFFEDDILGSSDTYSVKSWGIAPDNFDYPEFIKDSVKTYKETMVKFPSSNYVNGNIHHLWHGSRKNKQYGSRDAILKGVNNIKDVLTTDKNGLFKLKNTSRTRKIRKNLVKYFTNRDDDGMD